MQCWPKLESITTLETTLSLVQHVENISVFLFLALLIQVILTSSDQCHLKDLQPSKISWYKSMNSLDEQICVFLVFSLRNCVRSFFIRTTFKKQQVEILVEFLCHLKSYFELNHLPAWNLFRRGRLNCWKTAYYNAKIQFCFRMPHLVKNIWSMVIRVRLECHLCPLKWRTVR